MVLRPPGRAAASGPALAACLTGLASVMSLCLSMELLTRAVLRLLQEVSVPLGNWDGFKLWNPWTGANHFLTSFPLGAHEVPERFPLSS